MKTPSLRRGARGEKTSQRAPMSSVSFLVALKLSARYNDPCICVKLGVELGRFLPDCTGAPSRKEAKELANVPNGPTPEPAGDAVVPGPKTNPPVGPNAQFWKPSERIPQISKPRCTL